MKLITASLVFVTACGGTDHDPGIVSTTAARSAIDQLGKISASMTSPDGAEAVAGIQALVVAAHGIVSPSDPGGQPRGEPFVPQPVGATTGTASCTAASCRFVDYGYGVPYIAYSVNGSVLHDGGTLTFDVDYKLADHLDTTDWQIDGALRVAAGSIAGTLHLRGDGRGTLDDSTWLWDIVLGYDAVVLDDAGCPTGGSVIATTSYDGPAREATGPATLRLDLEATVRFGPICGDAH